MKKADFLRKAVVISAALFLSLGLSGEKVEANDISEATAPIIIMNDEKIQLDVSPQIQNGRVFVPLRGVFEKFGAVVIWEPDTQTITISDSVKKIKLRTKSQVVTINNEEHNLDTAPFIVNGRTMIPLRFVSENLNAKVDWVQASKTVEITTPNKEIAKGSVSHKNNNNNDLVVPNEGENKQNQENQQNQINQQNQENQQNQMNKQNQENQQNQMNQQNQENQQTQNNQNSQDNDYNEEIEKAIIELISDIEEVKVGQTFDVKVWVRDVADLYTMEVQLAYSPNFLKAKSLKGEFLGGSDIIKLIDKNNGIIDHVSTKLGQVPGQNGEGVLTIVTFEALTKGSTEISFTGDGVLMVNSSGKFMDYTEKTASIKIIIKE